MSDPIGDAGKVSLVGDTQAWRDAAGRNAILDNPSQDVPDLEYCFQRIEEIRDELGVLYSKLYATQMTPKNGWGETDQPPWKQRIAIQTEVNRLCEEEHNLQARIYELQWILPVNDQDNDEAEDEDEAGDNTQPEFVKRALTQTAQKETK